MSLDRLQSLIDRIAKVRIACLGDLMVDRYVYGEVSRISPEAPIPVMTRTSEAVMLGGAGNAARNVAALGATAVLAGVAGDDAEGDQALALIDAEPRLTGLIARAKGRPTTVKTRFVASGQQLLRLDAEDDRPFLGKSAEDWQAVAEQATAGADAVILSDYAKGAVSSELAAAVVEKARARGAPVIVDPKGRSFA